IALQNQSLQEKVLSYLSHNKDSLHTLTQRHIANALNIAPESLSRTLKTLKTQGILTTHKGKVKLL
ncbi:MAG: helix-turn-helix domain-containing protein, partial [Helicobacter sp.]